MTLLTSKCTSHQNSVHFFDIQWLWKYASHHNAVQFLTFHLASWFRTRQFSEPTCRPSEVIKERKITMLRAFPTLPRTCILFLLSFSLSDPLSSDVHPVCFFLTVLFHLSILSEDIIAFAGKPKPMHACFLQIKSTSTQQCTYACSSRTQSRIT